MAETVEVISPAFPLKNEKHTEIEIKIVEITDGAGNSIMGGGTEYDVRIAAVSGGTKTKIKYELKHHESLIAIQIHPDPGNAVATNYYGKVPAVEFIDYVSPGEHTIEWDGRSSIDGRRLLIQGEYKVKAWAACDCGNEVTNETKIKVKKPYADAYGTIYPTHYGKPANLTPPAAHVRTKLGSLSDGSGFECGGASTTSASDAMDRMRDYSAVWYWDGHAAPGIIDFYSAALHNTVVVSHSSVGVAFGMPAADTVAVDSLAEGALDHVFLVVLLGCETARTPPGTTSLPDALVGKGVDLVVAFPDKVYLRSYLKWTRDFFEALDKGNGVGVAARRARRLAPMKDRRRLSSRLFPGGGGAGAKDKLLPARNGRQKR